MDLIEQVREIGADEARVDDENVCVARTALTREMARSVGLARAGRRRRAWAGVGIGGLVAGTAVTAIVVGSVLAPVKAPDAAAASVFTVAAAATLSAHDAVVHEGQYLRIEATRDYLVTDADVRGAPVSKNAFRYVEVDVLYVPADRSQEWVYDFSTPTEVTERWGDDEAAFEHSVMSGYDYRETGVVRMPGGMRGTGDSSYPVVAHLGDFDSMPRDPEQLLAWFREVDGAAPGYEGLRILETLYLGVAPADLRAALFQALALIPDFEVTDRDGSLVTLTWTKESESQQLVVDTVSGTIVAVLTASREKPGSVVPADQPGMRQTISTSVVDSAP